MSSAPQGKKTISFLKTKAHLKQEKKAKIEKARGQNKPSLVQDVSVFSPREKEAINGGKIHRFCCLELFYE